MKPSVPILLNISPRRGQYLYLLRSSVFFCLATFVLLIQASAGSPVLLCLPGNGTLWNGVFAPVQYHLHEMEITDASIRSYINLTGVPPEIIAFSHEWEINRSFPGEQIGIIRSYHAIPYIRLMMRYDVHQYRPEPIFTLKRIREGYYDNDLAAFARDARELGIPIIIEYGTEVNGWWFSWNGYWTGEEKGAELFREAYRHIIRTMKEEGADNLIWVYHINWISVPDEFWNTYSAYYPGDEYIDLIGVSIYGAQKPYTHNNRSFAEMMRTGYQAAHAISPGKRIILSEMGTDLFNPFVPASVWTDHAFRDLITERLWPDVFAFIWWNSAWPNDNNPKNNTTMRIEENEAIQDIFKKYLPATDSHTGCIGYTQNTGYNR